jgi:ParB-like chromosome segregation protein Spo0J
VASPEMRLLELSIREDGYTQPIVVAPDGDQYVVVDGFHRNRVGKEIKDIRQRVFGHLPVVILDKDAGSRMASTIRHNRARGKHQVDLMGELVRELVQKGWPDNKIAKHLGMSVEELLRLKQIVGIAKLLGTPEYSKSWGDINEEGYAPDPVQ